MRTLLILQMLSVLNKVLFIDDYCVYDYARKFGQIFKQDPTNNIPAYLARLLYRTASLISDLTTFTLIFTVCGIYMTIIYYGFCVLITYPIFWCIAEKNNKINTIINEERPWKISNCMCAMFLCMISPIFLPLFKCKCDGKGRSLLVTWKIMTSFIGISICAVFIFIDGVREYIPNNCIMNYDDKDHNICGDPNRKDFNEKIIENLFIINCISCFIWLVLYIIMNYFCPRPIIFAPNHIEVRHVFNATLDPNIDIQTDIKDKWEELYTNIRRSYASGSTQIQMADVTSNNDDDNNNDGVMLQIDDKGNGYEAVGQSELESSAVN